jgi:hypothetical protein
MTEKEFHLAQTIAARPEPRMSQTTYTTSLKVNLILLNYPPRDKGTIIAFSGWFLACRLEIGLENLLKEKLKGLGNNLTP